MMRLSATPVRFCEINSHCMQAEDFSSSPAVGMEKA